MDITLTVVSGLVIIIPAAVIAQYHFKENGALDLFDSLRDKFGEAVLILLIGHLAFFAGTMFEEYSDHLADAENSIIFIEGEEELRSKALEGRLGVELEALGIPLTNINALYFFAKNRVFLNSTYFEELDYIKSRGDFGRSLVLGSTVGIVLMTIALFLSSWEKIFVSKCHRIIFLPAFVLTWVLGYALYRDGELEFNSRVFGYFSTSEQVASDMSYNDYLNMLNTTE